MLTSGLVKALQASARTHGVAQVRENASKDRVSQVVTALRAKSLDRDERKSFEDTVEKYWRTFSDGQAAVAYGEAQDSYRLRGCSFLLKVRRASEPTHDRCKNRPDHGRKFRNFFRKPYLASVQGPSAVLWPE